MGLRATSPGGFFLALMRSPRHHYRTDPTAMEEQHVSLQITLPVSIDQRLTAIQKQLGLRSKSALISLMLQEVFEGADEE